METLWMIIGLAILGTVFLLLIWQKMKRTARLDVPDEMEQGYTYSFDEITTYIGNLKAKAQTTFLHKLVEKLSPSVLKTLIYYCNTKLKYGQVADSRSQQRTTNKTDGI